MLSARTADDGWRHAIDTDGADPVSVLWGAGQAVADEEREATEVLLECLLRAAPESGGLMKPGPRVRLTIRPCPVCGAPWKPRKSTHRSCSLSCGVKAYWQRKRAGKA